MTSSRGWTRRAGTTLSAAGASVVSCAGMGVNRWMVCGCAAKGRVLQDAITAGSGGWRATASASRQAGGHLQQAAAALRQQLGRRRKDGGQLLDLAQLAAWG